MSKVKKPIMPLVTLTLLVTFLSACSNKQPERKIKPQDVSIVLAQQQDVVYKYEFVGQVSGQQDVSIRARVAGYLEGIHFRQGFPVKKGQLLYTIDDQPYQAEVAAAQSKLAEAKSQFAKADNDLKRYKPLAKSHAVSQSDLDAAQNQYDAAVAMVQAAEANLDIAKVQLSYTKIHSPIDGIIGKTLAEVGELVGQMPAVQLNTVSQMDVIYVEFFLPENQYLALAKSVKDIEAFLRDERPEKGNLELKLADGSIHAYKGTVNFIDRGVNSQTGTILVQTKFANPNLLIRPGQYTKVLIPVTIKDAIVIPQKCVKELQGQFSVFVVNAENKIETRNIIPGVKINDIMVVDDGLEAGDRIVLEGIQKVRNGVPVNAQKVAFKSQSSSL